MAKKRRTRSYNKKSIIKAVAFTAFMIVCILVAVLPNAPTWGDISKWTKVNSGVVEKEGNFYVHFIDVGQADCILMTCDDKAIMIDAGETDSY